MQAALPAAAPSFPTHHIARHMTSTRLLALLPATLLAACATPAGDSVVLSQDAVNRAALLAPAAADGQTSLSEAQLTQTIPYNLGSKVRSTEAQRSVPLSNGLKETILSGSTMTASGPAAGTNRMVSLCGLVPLVHEVGSPGTAASIVFTGRAGAFVPLGGSVPMSTRQITTSFEGGTPDLCRPQPGMAFSFKVGITLETNIPPFRRVVEFTETYQCRASDRFDGYAALKEAGATVVLACDISGAPADRPSRKEFVYLPQALEYFPVLVKVSDANYTNYSYVKAPGVVPRP